MVEIFRQLRLVGKMLNRNLKMQKSVRISGWKSTNESNGIDQFKRLLQTIKKQYFNILIFNILIFKLKWNIIKKIFFDLL